MFKYLLQNLWKNIFARIGILFFVFLLLFGLIYKSKNRIYIFFNQLSKGMEFDNVSSYDNKPYGYSEDYEKAKEFFQEGIEELTDIVFDTYDIDLPDKIFSKEINLKIYWKDNLQKTVYQKLRLFFSDMQLFCKPFIEKSDIILKEAEKRKLDKRTLKKQIKNKPNPFGYVIEHEKYIELVETLQNIDMKYFETSFQKKPDNLSLITLREDLNNAICKPYRNIQYIKKAVYYVEYKTEKKIYYNMLKIQKKVDFEILLDKTFTQLYQNEYYIRLLKKFFLQSRVITKDIDWKLKQSYTLFLKTNDKMYLSSYIKDSLAKARVSPASVAYSIHNRLYGIQYNGINKDFDYVYALAETAFLSHQLMKKANHLVLTILKQHIYQNVNQYRNTKRLYLLIQLSI